MDAPPPPTLSTADIHRDYSPETTLSAFPHPLPLLRGPIKAGPLDDPSFGPYLLAFRDVQSWADGYRACEALIIEQCESGTRLGCSVSASRKCKPAWWKTVVGGYSNDDFKDRVRCEEREMEACMLAAKGKCIEFAKKKCLPAFENARIQVNGSSPEAAADWKEVSRLISAVCFEKSSSFGVGLLGFEKPWNEFGGRLQMTNIRGRDLLCCDKGIDIHEYLKKCSKK